MTYSISSESFQRILRQEWAETDLAILETVIVIVRRRKSNSTWINQCVWRVSLSKKIIDWRRMIRSSRWSMPISQAAKKNRSYQRFWVRWPNYTFTNVIFSRTGNRCMHQRRMSMSLAFISIDSDRSFWNMKNVIIPSLSVTYVAIVVFI